MIRDPLFITVGGLMIKMVEITIKPVIFVQEGVKILVICRCRKSEVIAPLYIKGRLWVKFILFV